METRNEFIPFSISHPGQILGLELEERGIKQKEFAKQIGMQATHLNSLIKGRMNVSDSIALKLEDALGIPALEWMSMQNKYTYFQEQLELRGKDEAVAMQKENELKFTLNIKAIYEAFCITDSSSAKRIDTLFSIGNPECALSMELSCGGYFKKSEKCQVDERNMRTWLFIAHCKAKQITIENDYSPNNAEHAAVEIAKEANKGTLSTAGIKSILNKNGIGYIHVGKLEKTPVDAYSTLVNGKYVIVVTYRCNDLDKLAFDVLHELGHISLHIKNEGEAFISADITNKDAKEREADEFAENHLIPPAVWKKLLASSTTVLNPYIIFNSIGNKANQLGISPSIAVSRYKHDTNSYKFKNFQSPKLR